MLPTFITCLSISYRYRTCRYSANSGKCTLMVKNIGRIQNNSKETGNYIILNAKNQNDAIIAFLSFHHILESYKIVVGTVDDTNFALYQMIANVFLKVKGT